MFLDKKGTVRKTRGGFNGPVTGEPNEAFKSEFDSHVKQLLEG